MAQVLLAWELGGNSGHAVRLARLVSALAQAGHATSLAVQRPDAFRPWRDVPGFARMRQAPIWPGLLRHAETPSLRSEAAWGDLLASVGMTDSGVLEYLLRCWDQLFADARPDLIIADFAPAAVLAAQDRVPVITVGTGFTVPPHDAARFPLLRSQATRPLIDEDLLLQVVNRALWRLDRPKLDRLTQMARSTISCPATFTELDPYGPYRTAAPLPPFLSGSPGNAGDGQAIFAYFAVTDPRTRMLMQALGLVAARGFAVSAWLPGLVGPDAEDLARSGVHLHRAAVPQAEIASGSRLLVGSGGLGTTSAALAAGLPLAILPVDLEKRLTAEAVAGLGAGCVLQAGQDATARTLADQIIAAASDPTAIPRATARALNFRARIGDPASLVARHVGALCGRAQQ